MLERWVNAKPWGEKKVSCAEASATSATSATDELILPQGERILPQGVAEIANVAEASVGLTFLSAPLRMPDGRLSYRLAAARDGTTTLAAVALVSAARAAHVVVVADGTLLHIYTPVFYSSDLHLQLAALAPDVLAVLRQQSAQRAGHLQSGPEYTESANAASVELDAGVPRSWAEGYVALRRAPAPAWAALRPGMWADLVNVVGLFLARWGRQAAALGWDSIDLFGALPCASFARIDQQGLAFFLRNECSLAAMTADTASIRLPSGVVQTFRRPRKSARAPRTAPVWDLVGEPSKKQSNAENTLMAEWF